MPQPIGQDPGIVGLALDAVILRPIVALAVTVALAIGLVVLLLVGDEVGQREPVVGRDEVDARMGTTAVRGVQVGTSGQAVAEVRQRLGRAAPEVPDRVPIAAVPLRPGRREVADLVAALADIPGLGDQLHLVDHRVLVDEIEECREPVHLVEFARERGCKIEPEAIHVHLTDPVAEAVHDQLEAVRVTDIKGVAGARVVHVAPSVMGHETVVGRVVDALERQHRTEIVALGRVVVDDVEDHLDVGCVEGLHHALEFGHLAAALGDARVAVVRRKEPQRVVAPVVPEALRGEVRVVHELVDRQQLDRGHAEGLEVVDGDWMGQAGVRAAEFGWDARVPGREALDVDLVDDRPVRRMSWWPVVSPVEIGVDHDAPRHERRTVRLGPPAVRVVQPIGEDGGIPLDLALESLRIGIHQELGGIAAMARAGIPGTVNAIAIALPTDDLGQVGMPHEAGRFGHLDPHLGAIGVEQAQLDALGHLGEQGEVGAPSVVGGAERVGDAGPDGRHRPGEPRSEQGGPWRYGTPGWDRRMGTPNLSVGGGRRRTGSNGSGARLTVGEARRAVKRRRLVRVERRHPLAKR